MKAQGSPTRGLVARAVVAAALVFAIGAQTASAQPVPGVDPPLVDVSLAPGETTTVTKTVQTTAIPPLVDIMLLEDETGSFADDIATLQSLAAPGGPLITALDATGADYATGVAGFRDFAQNGWGDPGDWVYQRYADVSAGGSGLVSGVPLLTAGGGGDTPEAQLEALHYLADPGHAAIDSNGNASTADPEDTPAGEQPTWRTGAKRVVLLATDAECHVTGDPPTPGWPGDAGTTSAADTAAILAANNITVIGLTPGGAGTIACVDTLAAGTGGTVHAAGADASTIVAAIMAGLTNLPVTVEPIATCGAGVSVSFAPPSQTVTSGDQAVFAETIMADPTATEGATVTCTVDFLVDGTLPGPEFTQTITVSIPFLCAGEVATIVGTTGDDALIGTPGADVIQALDGDDAVLGLGGNDLICGNEGDDELLGGAGRDRLIGDFDDDSLFGGRGRDELDGSNGADEVDGGRGDDALAGGSGRDELVGGSDDDELSGNSGADDLFASAGDDIVFGGPGTDDLNGGRGDDQLSGENGDDDISGNGGDDVLFGGFGDDELFGSGGDDQLSGETGDDELTGGTGNDSLDGGADVDDCDGGFGTDADAGCEVVISIP
jgi:Ca2+-binding RTX toxin-like protein